MRNISFFCLIYLITLSGYSQRIKMVSNINQGFIELSEDIQIPKVASGYTLFLPADAPVGGLVFFHAERDTSSMNSITHLAMEKNLAVLFVTTENSLEFLFETNKMLELENYIHMACLENQIPEEKLLFSGMSLEGTRALKMAIFASSSESQYKIKPRAVAVCDSPLDMVRFWSVAEKSWRMNLNEIAANEGKWVSQYLVKNLKGKPEEVMPNYVNYSPFCYSASQGGNVKYLKDIAVRAYTEPDVHWWIDNRGKDYYSMNAIDLAAMVNQLKIDGNEISELILTEDKGYRPDGSRHPHSWSIVDENELLDWFLSLL